MTDTLAARDRDVSRTGRRSRRDAVGRFDAGPALPGEGSKRALRDFGDARSEIEDALEPHEQRRRRAGTGATPAGWPRALPWAVARGSALARGARCCGRRGERAPPPAPLRLRPAGCGRVADDRPMARPWPSRPTAACSRLSRGERWRAIPALRPAPRQLQATPLSGLTAPQPVLLARRPVDRVLRRRQAEEDLRRPVARP